MQDPLLHRKQAGLGQTWQGKYQLRDEPFFDGGDRVLYKCTSIKDGKKKDLVIKMATFDLAKFRFQREIEVGTTISHENVMPILEADSDALWFVMPVAEQDPLNPSQKMSDEQLFEMVRQNGAGLAVAHELGYVHRDLKPANILRLDDRFAVADWGLARNPPGTTNTFERTASDLPQGTEGWAAPEQFRGAHDVTAAADIWSIGQILGWLITAEHPDQNIPLLPPDGPWREVIETCCRKEPTERPQTSGELLSHIANIVPIHNRSELVARIHDLGGSLPARIQRERGYRNVYAVEWEPSGKVTWVAEDFNEYKRFAESNPSVLRCLGTERPPLAREWTNADLLKRIDTLTEKARKNR